MQSYDFLPALQRRQRKSKFFFWTIVVVCVLGIIFLASIALAYKFYSTSEKVIDNKQPASFIQTIKDIASSDRKPLRGEENGRINILLVGLAGKNYPGANLTDSIIVASVNPKTYQTALLSIPRDLYVQIPDTRQERGSLASPELGRSGPEAANSYTKINALYTRSEDTDVSGKSGINDLKKTVSDITGLDINYYIALDFDGFRQIIDELGGVKIQVPKDIHDERYPGPNYSYETFDIKQGLYSFDGETALKYARTRHDEDDDFGRAYRQQQILEAARSKAFSLGTVLNIPEINRMLDTLGEHLRTDVGLDEINSFLDLVNKVDTHTTVNYVLDAGRPDSVMAVSHVSLGGVRAFILIPRTGNYDETRDIAQSIFDLDVIERKKKEIASENASVAIANESGVKGFDAKLSSLLKKLGYSVGVSPRQNSVVSQTVIYDLADGLKPFSLEDLSKKFSAKIATGLPNEVSPRFSRGETSNKEPDFILVAGSDLTDKLNYEENSVSDLESGYDQQSIDEKGYIDLLKKGSDKKF